MCVGVPGQAEADCEREEVEEEEEDADKEEEEEEEGERGRDGCREVDERRAAPGSRQCVTPVKAL